MHIIKPSKFENLFFTGYLMIFHTDFQQKIVHYGQQFINFALISTRCGKTAYLAQIH